MDLQFYGANCLGITTKKISIIVDDNLDEIGRKSITKEGDIVLQTFGITGKSSHGKIVINYPGEYEVGDVSIQGVAARAHIDENGLNSVIYKITASDVRLVILGHIYPELSEQQLEAIGTVDVLCIPVGGNGYTLDAAGALKCIKKIEPKLIIPTHYAFKGLNYQVPQAQLEDILKELSMEATQPVDKLKLKAGDFGESAGLSLLEIQA
ncbi:MAG: MBL fold metallo-hydrolase [Patescibacteria group bacterium]